MHFMQKVDDEETRLKAADWANIVTYRIFTRALGTIGKFHFRWSNITRVSTRLKKKFSKFDMVRVFKRPKNFSKKISWSSWKP